MELMTDFKPVCLIILYLILCMHIIKVIFRLSVCKLDLHFVLQ